MDIIWGSCFKGEIYMNFPLSENLSGHITLPGKIGLQVNFIRLEITQTWKKKS
jgi:hypothetical protein